MLLPLNDYLRHAAASAQYISPAYLFKLQFRIDPHVADLTVEGSFLSVGVQRPPSLLSTGLRAQAGVRLDGAEPAPCLQNSFVFSTCKQTQRGIIASGIRMVLLI